MRYPVNYIAISQGYHCGKSLDFGWNSKYGGQNQPIIACAKGVVKQVEKQTTGGNVVFIDYPEYGVRACYGHLQTILVKKGQEVNEAQQIGTMGNTGVATGNHLHFGLYPITDKINYGNATIDPFEVCEVYPNQVVGSTTANKYKNKIKYHTEEVKSYPTKTVTSKGGLNVRNKASIFGKIIGTLKNGDKVNVLENKGNWSKIGTNKWVYSKYLK